MPKCERGKIADSKIVVSFEASSDSLEAIGKTLGRWGLSKVIDPTTVRIVEYDEQNPNGASRDVYVPSNFNPELVRPALDRKSGEFVHIIDEQACEKLRAEGCFQINQSYKTVIDAIRRAMFNNELKDRFFVKVGDRNQTALRADKLSDLIVYFDESHNKPAVGDKRMQFLRDLEKILYQEQPNNIDSLDGISP